MGFHDRPATRRASAARGDAVIRPVLRFSSVRAPARLTSVGLALLAGSCGGGSGSPTGPGGGPTPPPGNDVVVVVFYDQDGDGTLGANEAARLGGVTVEAGGRSGRAAAGTGRAVVQGVPNGTYTAAIRAFTLPPYYVPEPGVTVTAPQPAGQEARLATTLPIGGNRPNTYMAFGDSISVGEGSSDGMGYRGRLQSLLEGQFARAEVLNRGDDATRTGEGAERIGRGLRQLTPAYTLIQYGTNDYNDLDCRTDFPCFTISSLQTIIRACKEARSLPVLATILPPNPALESSERSDWVVRMNQEIRALASEEGVVLADLHADFMAERDLPSLFSDHVHPNDKGYAIIADVFFKAIAGPAAASSSSSADTSIAPSAASGQAAAPHQLLHRPSVPGSGDAGRRHRL